MACRKVDVYLKRECEMKPISILIILLFAFTLAACGGGGSSGPAPMAPEEPMEPMEPEPTPEEQAAADAAMKAANDAATTANAAAMAAMDAVNAATLADSMAASDAATAATAAAQAATAAATAVMAGDMATVDAANAAAMAANDAADAANMAASDLNMAEADAQAEAERMAAAEQARIMGLTAAIADPDGDGMVPESGELHHRNRPSAAITFDDDMIVVGGDTLRKNDTNIKNDYEFGNTPAAAEIELPGFDGAVYRRTTEKGAMDTVTVYTDVEEAGDVLFNDFFIATGDDGAQTDDADGFTVTDVTDAQQTAAGEDGETQYDMITFAANVSPAAKHIMSSRIPTTPGTNVIEPTVSRGTGTGGADELIYVFTGSFYGVSGTFRCASACVITLGSGEDDVFTVVDGVSGTPGPVVLTFRPENTVNDTEDQLVVAGVTKDDDYMAFGYWMQTSGSGDNMKYGVGVFEDGAMPYGGATASTEIQQLTGKATYDGSATGMYARKELTVQDGRAVVGNPVDAGQFSADVSLTAYFNNVITVADATVANIDSISNAQRFSISGTVDNFQDASGDMIDSGWSVNLGKASFATFANDGTISAATNSFSGSTGSGSMVGEWEGTFYGDAADKVAADFTDITGGQTAAQQAATANATNYPTSVAGEFTGHFTNGHVIGAFGAK